MATISLHPLGAEATGDVKLDTLRAVGTLGELCESLDALDADDPLSELERIGIVHTLSLLLEFLWRIGPAATYYVWSRDLPYWQVGRNAFLVQLNDGRVLGWSRGADDTEREGRVLKTARAYFRDDDQCQASNEAGPSLRTLGVVGDASDELVCAIVGP